MVLKLEKAIVGGAGTASGRRCIRALALAVGGGCIVAPTAAVGRCSGAPARGHGVPFVRALAAVSGSILVRGLAVGSCIFPKGTAVGMLAPRALSILKRSMHRPVALGTRAVCEGADMESLPRRSSYLAIVAVSVVLLHGLDFACGGLWPGPARAACIATMGAADVY